jgi:hypothetical protein
MGCGGRWSLTAPADGTDCLLLPSVTPFTAVTDGLSVSAAGGHGLDKGSTSQLLQGFSAWPVLACWPLAKRFGQSTGGPGQRQWGEGWTKTAANQPWEEGLALLSHCPYLSLRKSQTKEARILPLRGRVCFRRSREAKNPQACLRTCNTLDIRFAASEPATNKALQEVRVLGGFGLLVALKTVSRGCRGAVHRSYFSSYCKGSRLGQSCRPVQPGAGWTGKPSPDAMVCPSLRPVGMDSGHGCWPLPPCPCWFVRGWGAAAGALARCLRKGGGLT